MGDVPVLEYGDLATQMGVAVETRPEISRIIVEPQRGWKMMSKAHRRTVIGLSIVIVFMSFNVLTAKPAEWSAIIPNLVAYSLALLIVLCFAYLRQRRRTIFEITPARFSISQLYPNGHGTTVTWARGKIGRIRVNPFNDKLIVQVFGEDTILYWLGPEKRLTTYVAEAVEQAMSRMPEASPRKVQEEIPPIVPRHWKLVRPITITIAAVLGLTGVVAFIVGGPMRGLGIYFLIAAGVPLGIMYGTQDKEYYV